MGPRRAARAADLTLRTSRELVRTSGYCGKTAEQMLDGPGINVNYEQQDANRRGFSNRRPALTRPGAQVRFGAAGTIPPHGEVNAFVFSAAASLCPVVLPLSQGAA